MSCGSPTRIREKTTKGITTLNHQTNRNGGSCGNDTRSGSCPYGRTPWGSRETCNFCRRPWSTRSSCGSCSEARTSCPCTASTTWRNRGEGCACATPRIGSCSCGNTTRIGSCGCDSAREARNTCSCGASRDSDCDDDCNHGAASTGILDGKSLAMVYSPYQRFDALYDPRQGLCHGTIFTGLDKPFHGDGRGC